jgi:hypothetical protein
MIYELKTWVHADDEKQAVQKLADELNMKVYTPPREHRILTIRKLPDDSLIPDFCIE